MKWQMGMSEKFCDHVEQRFAEEKNDRNITIKTEKWTK